MNLFENLQLYNESKNITFELVQKEIQDLKHELKNTNVIEDFGQDKVRNLKNKYNEFSLMDLDSQEKIKILKIIDNFNEWCMTYTGK